jgi:DNA polymerase III alpha subunit
MVKDAACRGESHIGIADNANTYAHIKLRKHCNTYGIKPIYGVRLKVTDCCNQKTSARGSYNHIAEFVFIAKNNDGLTEIYKLVNTAYENFYYFPRLTYDDVILVSKNVFVIANGIAKNKLLAYHRIDFFGELISGPVILDRSFRFAQEHGTVSEKPRIALLDNKYPRVEDKEVYETLSYPRMDLSPHPQWILNEDEMVVNGMSAEAIENTHILAEQCNADIQDAPMVKFKEDKNLRDECIKRAKKLKIDLTDKVYGDRFEYELEMIKSRDYDDYFLIVADMLMAAKKYCLVGPARGSSGGSLVCYLLGITEIDPIKFGLLFERFIDVNRSNLPDIDTDIPDVNRQSVIRYLTKKYGQDNVRAICTIARYKGRSAIIDFSKALGVPESETSDLKSSIIERRSGDDRAKKCIEDTLHTTEAGKLFLGMYPGMEVVKYIEDHARHAGKHAAGVIVSNEPLYKYAGIDARESTIMLEGKEAESINLLKIDVLGVRTLSVLQETARLAGFDYHDFYELPLDDVDTFKIFNDGRVYGVFQFEGDTLANITSQMGVESFDDICAITSLARPGALSSGGAEMYVQKRTGVSEPKYYGDVYERITKNTYGIVVYQEQTMMILKEFGNLSWGDVDILRKAMSKSLGDEFFAKYKDRFVSGAVEQGHTEEEAEEVWQAVSSMGSYGFNKSHAVAYSLISYWTAWCKAHYPLEFAAANLNNAKSDEVSTRLLRDFVTYDGIEYIPFDAKESEVLWSIKGGKLVGGLTNLHGIGVKKAQKIIKDRETGSFTKAIAEKMANPVTPFDILFPTKHYFGHIFENPNDYGLAKAPTLIKDVREPGDYVIIGCVAKSELRDRNDAASLAKRKGKRVDKNQFFLNLQIEDDTGVIRCSISPMQFEELNGSAIASEAVEGETWYIIRGEVSGGWRSISIDSITNLKNFMRTQHANTK